MIFDILKKIFKTFSPFFQNNNRINFYTFCVDVGRHDTNTLKRALNLLIDSAEYHLNNYKLIVYTNFKIENNNQNIEFRKYYDSTVNKLYNTNEPTDDWLNLSFNKINIYKDLYDEFKKDFIWIDIDTIITHDISYVNNYSNFFTEIGGPCTDDNRLFHNSDISIPRNRYIQGNFFKLNINLYNALMKSFQEIIYKDLKLRYDLQDLFGYHLYHKCKNKNINVLGYNIRKKTAYGLYIWSKKGNTHPSLDGLKLLHYTNNKLISNLCPDKEIHIVSFTFMTLKELWNTEEFNTIFSFNH